LGGGLATGLGLAAGFAPEPFISSRPNSLNLITSFRASPIVVDKVSFISIELTFARSETFVLPSMRDNRKASFGESLILE